MKNTIPSRSALNTQSEAMQRMIKGRVGLIAREPFFATLALEKLTLVEDAKCESTWTDGRRLGFNPERILKADSIDELEAIWAHHVATCALGHPFRRGARDEKLWNEASDHVVNGYITKAGFKLPEGSLYDQRFDGMYVEQVYHQLKQEQMPPEEGDDDGDSKGGTDSAGVGGGDDTGDMEPTDDPSAGKPSVPGDRSGAAGDGAGAAATGEVRDATSEDGSSDNQPASEAELAEQAKDWETCVAQAEQAARGAGRLSADVERMAKSAVAPRVDWREALQRLLKAKSKDDYSLRRPHKRSFTMGFIMPSLDAPRCGPLGFAIDYSSSIRQHEVDQFSAEVEDARATLNPEKIIVMIFTTSVVQYLEFNPGEPIELPPVRSGGGTDFAPPVIRMNECETPPEVLVYLTDLDCSSFAPEPEYPVVWVTTLKTEAPYGEVIRMY